MKPVSVSDAIMSGLQRGDVIPYLGPGVLQGVTDLLDGSAMPADSDSLIYAMTGGQAMAPRLMYEFPRAAMHMENKKGRTFIEQFLTRTYGERRWSESALHRWVASLHLPYVIDCNRDTQLQVLYADRPHTLVVGAARIAATPYRFDLYQWHDSAYLPLTLDQVDTSLPILFKPLGTPHPKPSYVASDADFVDYITELMGGFAVPAWIKQFRLHKRYLFLGMRFNRDTDRMVMSELIYGAAAKAGWALIDEPSDKELRFCTRKQIQIIDASIQGLLGMSAVAA